VAKKVQGKLQKPRTIFKCPDCGGEVGRVLYVPPASFKKPQSGFLCEPCEILFGRANVVEEPVGE